MTAIKSMLHAKTWFLFFIAFVLTKEGTSQTEKQFIPPSPQSQEFIKYGDYPVSYFSGVPDISIPLHQVDFYGYKMPVTLKYHASGIKAGSHVDQTGLGFTLFCGGEISRTVKSVPDETNDFKKGIFIVPAESFYYKKLLELSNGYPSGSPIGDLAYDEFNVTLPNGNFFKFFISNINGTYQVHTNPAPSGMKVSFVYPLPHNVGSTITSFTVIDEQGVKYDFTEAEQSEGMYGSHFKTTWKLTLITLPQSNKTIRFKYKAANDIIVPKKNYTRTIRDSIGQISCVVCMGYPNNRCVESIPKGVKTSWVVSDYTQDNTNFNFLGLVTDSIIFGDNNIKFNYDVLTLPGYSSSKLNNIALNDVNKKVSFYHTNVDGIGAITELDSIVIKSQQAIIPSLTYKFGYTTRSLNAGIAGRAPAIDHWGNIMSGLVDIDNRNEVYDCGGDGSFSTFNLPNFETMVAWPVNPSDECLFESWIGPDDKPRYKTKLGTGMREPEGYPELMLNRIDYPTGGYTLFDYENNKYLVTEINTTDPVMSAGGYRIKTISNYTNGILSGRKTYKYGVNECGYGYAPVEPSAKTYQRTYIDWAPYFSVGTTGPAARYRERNFSSDNFTSLLGSLPPVMYEEVTEYIGDTSNNTGKTIYKYNIMKRQPPETVGYGGDHLQTNLVTGTYYVLNDEQWKYGQLTDKEVYRKENTGYKLVQRQKQTWSYVPVANLDDRTGFYMYDRAIYSIFTDHFDQGDYAPCFVPNVFQSNPHYIRTGTAALIQSVTTEYTDLSDSIVNKEIYTYDTYGHMADKLTWNSKGATHQTVYKYPYDKNSSGFLTESLTAANIEALDTLVARNIVSPTIQESRYLSPNASTTKRTDYLLFGNKPLPKSIKSKINAFAIEEEFTFTQYDNIGNPLQYTGKDGVVTSLLWGYKGQYLVAKIAGADYTTASGKITQSILDNPSGDQALRVELDKLRTIPRSLVTTYTYRPSIGMTSQTDPNSRTLYYQYDGFNRLAVIRDQNQNIIKMFCYNYAGQPQDCSGVSYTSTKSGIFIKVCPDGSPGTSVTYTATATSYLSQEDADTKALNDVAANGQTHANIVGYCTYYNDEMTGDFAKNDCDPGYTGSLVPYTVPAARYTSNISKQDANDKALEDLTNNGPYNANAFGSCTLDVATIISVSSAPSNCYQVEFYNPSTGFDIWYDIANGGSSLGTIPPGNYTVNIYASGWGCTTAYRTYMLNYDGNSTSTSNSAGYAQFTIAISQLCQIFIQ